MFNVRLGIFTQRMLDDAIEAGVEFRDELQCRGVIVENGAVVGVYVGADPRVRPNSPPMGAHMGAPLRASLTIDVSGIHAVVRNSLPDELGIEKGIAMWGWTTGPCLSFIIPLIKDGAGLAGRGWWGSGWGDLHSPARTRGKFILNL
jgi:hypothetical protein